MERVEATTVESANAAIRRRLSSRDLWVAVVASSEQLGGHLREAIGEFAGDVVDRYDAE